MPFRCADLVVGAMQSGDATSHHTFEVARLLRARVSDVSICTSTPPGALPPDIRALVQHVSPADYAPVSDLTILQYAGWFPLAERFRGTWKGAVFWYHGVTPPRLWGTDAERDTLERSQMGTELVWHAHLAVACSPFTAGELHDLSGYPRERIRVIPIGVDTHRFAAQPDNGRLASLREAWHLEGKRVLLYTGRVAGNKRIDLLIDALALLADRYPDLHLLVVGDTSSMAAYAELAERLRARTGRIGLSGRVTLTGRVEEIEPYYHLADVYALASQHEGFGVPLVEAMAAGIPIVASASGSIPWVLGAEHAAGAAGLVFAPGDAADLARQIASLLDQPDLRQAMVARGRERATAFSPERFARDLDALLVELETLVAEGLPSPPDRPGKALYASADVALRDYRVRSRVPLVGRLIEWLRYNSTTHVKEAYLDRVIERQVLYNRLLADDVSRLQAELAQLRQDLERLNDESATGGDGPEC